MDILTYVDEFPPFFRGGLGTYAEGITGEFVKLGHHVTVFSRNLGGNPTREERNGIDIHRPLLADIKDILPVIVPGDVKRWPIDAQRFFGETLMYNILSYSKLVNQLVRTEDKKVDVITAHDWLTAPAGTITKADLKKPFVFHFHSTELGRVKNGSPTVKELEHMGGMHSDLVVTVSYAMRDELIKIGVEEKKIRVVYNGVDPEKYNPSRFSEDEIQGFREKIGVKKSDLMLLFIGRLTWVKGVDSLVRAMPSVLEEVPNAKLVILGSGEEEDLIKHTIVNLGIKENVITEFKYVNEDERILHYAACDVAVFPSKYEPFGIVCAEAMSMGKPVVVGAKGTSGLREQVVPSGSEKCGLHIDPFDPNDISKYLVELLQDKRHRKTLGDNGRKRVLDKFTIRQTAESTLRVYEEAIEKFDH